jgi:hypothetical protein
LHRHAIQLTLRLNPYQGLSPAAYVAHYGWPGLYRVRRQVARYHLPEVFDLQLIEV